MAGSMIHLLMAHKVNPKGSTLFYIGSIAPDALTKGFDYQQPYQHSFQTYM